MNTTNGDIIYQDDDGNEIKDVLLTYNEEERQQNEIDRENAKLVFSPKFIPQYPALLEKGLTLTECAIFGFIDFYKANGTNRFYFTNEQIAQIINCNPDTVSRAISSLEKQGLIKTSRKVKSGGGQIRFVTDISYKSDSTISTSQTRQKLQTNENKINDNKINNNNNALIAIKEAKPREKSFGNEDINWLVDEFQRIMKFKSSGSKDRFMAKHLINNFTREQISFMMKYCTVDKFAPRVGSIEALWYKKGDILAGIQKLKANSNVLNLD